MDKTTLFIAITAAAVILQAFFLAAMYFAMRKIGGNLETASHNFESRLFPVLEDTKKLQEQVRGILESSQPKVDAILDNLAAVSKTARTDIDRVDATLNDALDRARLQVIRADEMLTRTMDRVEETSEKVQHSVLSPIRQISGVMQGVAAGFGAFFGQKHARSGAPHDEMFI